MRLRVNGSFPRCSYGFKHIVLITYEIRKMLKE